MSKGDSLQVEITSDGSPTLFSEAFQAHYHSTHGALQESMHVFIHHGVKHFVAQHTPQEISILEFGLGTGLNALLTSVFAEERNHSIYYHGIEGYPVDPSTRNKVAQLYQAYDAYPKILECQWGKEIQISDGFTLYKEHVNFEDYIVRRKFDIIYYDAFAPSCQPELWEIPILEKTWDSLRQGGILTTFCAKGSFKRNLKALGFEVERLPGPPGKREMTRAVKI